MGSLILWITLLFYFVIGITVITVTVAKPTTKSVTSSNSNLCPIGDPLTEAGSVVDCGPKPRKSCPDSYYCEMDKKSKHGICCLKKGKNKELRNHWLTNV